MTNQRLLSLALVAAAATAGCAAGTSAGPDGRTYVLLDQDARGVVTLAQDDWSGSPVLPVALDATQPLTVTTPTGTFKLALRSGMLAHVHGAGASVEWREVGGEVRDDRLVVRGSEAAVDGLAELIAAKKGYRRPDGLFPLVASDIFERTSFLVPPDGIEEALPDARVDEASGGLVRSIQRAAEEQDALPTSDTNGAPPAGTTIAGNLPALVGLYTSDSMVLVLDASGGFSIEDDCSGAVRMKGRYGVDVGDQVELRTGGPGAIPLDRSGDDLVLGGVRFTPLKDDEPAKPGDHAGSAGEGGEQ
jgi:hypothetical protein